MPRPAASGAPSGAPACRSCRATLTELVLDLGLQPSAGNFPTPEQAKSQPLYPLQLWLCTACNLVQLSDTVSDEAPAVFESATSEAHAQASLGWLQTEFGVPAGGSVREFPSPHDAHWMPHAVAAGLRPAIDSEPADLVVDSHGMLHEPDLDESIRLRAAALSDSGVLIIEAHHLLSLVRGSQFDMVRHGHTMCLSLLALQPALQRNGLEVVSARTAPIHGGSLQVVARRAGHGAVADASVQPMLDDERAAGLDDPQSLRGLGKIADQCSTQLHAWLAELQESGRTVVAYGAPSKSPTLLCSAKVGPDLLPFTVDRSEAKHGLTIPGTGIPIRPVSSLLEARPDYVLVLIWDLVDEIPTQLPEVTAWGGKFVVPIPELRVLD